MIKNINIKLHVVDDTLDRLMYGDDINKYCGINTNMCEYTHIYSTMGASVRVMHADNTMGFIKVDNSALNSKFKDVVCPDGDGVGIYIYRQYIIRSFDREGYQELIHYYHTTRNTTYGEDINSAIYNKLIKEKSNPGLGGGKLVVRICGFIPRETLVKNLYVHSPSFGLSFHLTKGNVELVNPNSLVVTETKRTNDSRYNNEFKLDLISSDVEIAKYIKLGGRVIKLVSNRSKSKVDGVTITTLHNGVVTDELHITPEEYADNDIYDTAKMCEYNGDADLGIKKAKLTLSENEIKLKEEKIKYDKTKYMTDNLMVGVNHAHQLEILNTKEKLMRQSVTDEVLKTNLACAAKLFSLKSSIAMGDIKERSEVNKVLHEAEKMKIKEKSSTLDVSDKLITTLLSAARRL